MRLWWQIRPRDDICSKQQKIQRTANIASIVTVTGTSVHEMTAISTEAGATDMKTNDRVGATAPTTEKEARCQGLHLDHVHLDDRAATTMVQAGLDPTDVNPAHLPDLALGHGPHIVTVMTSSDSGHRLRDLEMLRLLPMVTGELHHPPITMQQRKRLGNWQQCSRMLPS